MKLLKLALANFLSLSLKTFSAQSNHGKDEIQQVLANYVNLTTKCFALDFYRLLHNEKVEKVTITVKDLSSNGKNKEHTFEFTLQNARLFFNPEKREIVAIKVYLRDKTQAKLKRNTEFVANRLYRYSLNDKKYRIDVKRMQWVEALAGIKI